jgi:transposase
MARPLSMDLRERVLEAVEGGSSRCAAAERFGLSASCAIKLMQRWNDTGSLEPGQMGGHKEHALAADAERVRALVRARPDLTIDELHAQLTRDGITVGRSAVGRFLQHLGLTRKKRRSMRPSRAARTSPRRAPSGGNASRR